MQRLAGEREVRLAERLVLGGVSVHEGGDVVGRASQPTISCASPICSPIRAPTICTPSDGAVLHAARA